MRKLLGGEPSRTAAPKEETAAPTRYAPQEESDGAAGELVFQTRYGRWVFRPPFALEEDEIGLIRLVAEEDEITAEYIRSRTGRRRATDDLDDLLDRLHEAGVEPIKEDNDRYRFDPDFMQD